MGGAGTGRLPAGTVTFLLTDIEGSSRLWEASSSDMARAVARHYELLDQAVAAHGGVRPVDQGEGDSVVAAFSLASDAVAAALAAQRALSTEPWPAATPVRVRMAVHTGEAELRDGGNYFGTAVIRCARLRSLAYGGQVLVSAATADLVADRLPAGASLVDRGLQRLKDLSRPERVWELCHPDLPGGFGPLRSLDRLPHNLPVQLTAFVGRTAELAELRSLLGSGRLVTLNGVGGCGKTRLALQLAAEAADQYAGGVWLVELAAVSEPERVPAAVAIALGERDQASDLVELLADRLGGPPALVVLDNCEHLLGPVAALVDVLLRRCPALTVIATSREPLGVPGERGWRVPNLSRPERSEPATPDAILRYDAVRLFVARAADARADFALTIENAAAVAQICERLDGIPLALELAAARVRGLSVGALAAALDDRFRLLTGGARTVLARQRTLQASIDWSYELLGDTERALFCRLAIFAGSFDLDAAEAVAAGPPLPPGELLGLLLGLVDKSMVTPVEDGDRYRIFETLRQYGQARLADTSQLAAVRDRHLAWAAALFDPRDYPSGPMETLAPVVDDLRNAFDWAMLRADNDRGHRLGHLVGNWDRFFGNPAAASIYAQALALEGGDPELVVLLGMGLAMCRYEMGRWDPAADAALIQTARALGDDYLLARCLMTVGYVTMPRPPLAIGPLTEATELAGGAGATALLEICWSTLASAHAYNGDWAEAERLAALVPPGDPGLSASARGVQLARWLACFSNGRFDEAREVQDTTVAAIRPRLIGGHPPAQALSQSLIVQIDWAQGRPTSPALDALRAALEEGRGRGLASALRSGWTPGAWALAHGDVDAAIESLAAWRDQTADQPMPIVEGAVLALGRAQLAIGLVEQARTLLEGINEPLEHLSAQVVAQLYHLDATIKRAEGDLAGAEALLQQILLTQHQRGWRPDLVHTLESLAGMAAAHAAFVVCARLAGAAQSLRDQMGYRLRWPDQQACYDADLAAAREALGDDAFYQAWAEGLQMDEEAAVAYTRRATG
jgi:predicted ATPase/class 3 adenylate cyclase